MAGIYNSNIILIKNLQALISVREPLETLPTDGKLKFDSKNNDSKSNYSNSSGNYDDDDDDEDKNDSNKFFDNDSNDKSYD